MKIFIILIVFLILLGCVPRQNTTSDKIEIVNNSISVSDNAENETNDRNLEKPSTLIWECTGEDKNIMYVDTVTGVWLYEEMDHRSKIIKVLWSNTKLSILEKHISNNPAWAHLDYNVYWYKVDAESEIGWVMDTRDLVVEQPFLVEDKFIVDEYHPTAIDYENILHGNLSAFAGIYRRSFDNHQIVLRSNGVILYGSHYPLNEVDEYTKRIAYRFRKHDDGYYFWNIGDHRVYLFPEEIEVLVDGNPVLTDTRRIRLCMGQDGPNSLMYNLIQRE